MGYASDEKAMDVEVARITQVFIFPKELLKCPGVPQ
jgi:hypothetical protein